jgi:hypothetical protein
MEKLDGDQSWVFVRLSYDDYCIISCQNT